ncbi:MAG TPA: BON domain-containing protein, partial [Thermoanaerobaculia bacterium]|nr:BON domain-containing protein [Thermoanaerobaculia bacterium]
MKGKVFSLLVAVLIAAGCAQSDADITAKIKTKLATDRSISRASHIEVATQKKIVTLTGTAETPVAKERAVTLARGTEDVKDV